MTDFKKDFQIKKDNLSDVFYFFLMCTLMLDRFSLIPSGFGVRLFPYQFISFLLIVIGFIIYEKIHVPYQIIMAYLLVFIQSGFIIMTDRADPSIILRENIQLVLLMALLIIIYNYFINRPRYFLKFINVSYHVWIISSLLLFILYLGYGMDFGVNIDLYFPYPRLKGFSGDPNVLGIYILTFLPMVLYQNRKNNKYKVFILILTTTVIFLTFSRANIFILFIFYLVYIIFGSILRKIEREEIILILLLILLFIFIMFSVFSMKEAFILRLQQFINDLRMDSDSRFGLWVRGLKLYRQYPILGIGIDHSPLYLTYYIHNTFIEWIASCGVFSIMILFLYIRYFIKHFSRRKESKIDFYFSLAYLLHILTLSFVSFLNFEPTFIIFGMSEAYFNVKEKMGNGFDELE